MSDRRSLAPKISIDADRILDLKAKGEAVESIRRALGSNGPGIRKIYQIIAAARAMHDPRAGDRKQGSGHGPPLVRRKRAPRLPGTALEGWWFGAETVHVMRLGFGSVDCQYVPVSVSCVPRRVVSQQITSKPRRKTDAHKTFADALAPLSVRMRANPQHEKPVHQRAQRDG